MNKHEDVLKLTPNHTTKLTKSNGDKIDWGAPGGVDWLVVFDDETPFNKYFFHKGDADSGPIAEDANPDPDKKYKYTIYVNAALHMDPNVVIE